MPVYEREDLRVETSHCTDSLHSQLLSLVLSHNDLCIFDYRVDLNEEAFYKNTDSDTGQLLNQSPLGLVNN